MPNKLTIALALIAIALATDARAQTEQRTLEVDDLFRIKRVSDPRISPDREWVAYTVRTTDLQEEKSETRIWMIPFSGGDPIPMTAAGTSASRPRWSPDGSYLSFLAARNDAKTQVWTLDRRGGDLKKTAFL